jgi:uncharacterized repeat protein (TIGR01451 family)
MRTLKDAVLKNLDPRKFSTGLLALIIGFGLGMGGSAAAQSNAPAYASQPVVPYVFNQDLSKLPPSPPMNLPAPALRTMPGAPVVAPLGLSGPDPLWQNGIPGTSTLAPGVTPPQFTNPVPNFDTNQPGDGPPDANGSVGPNHYIAIVNFTYQIFNKSGVSLAGPTNPATFWSSAPAGDACKNQRGDPYVLYDHLADRWVISFFANDPTLVAGGATDPLEWQCIAVSKGPNPVTDGWFAYSFFLGVANDYPKLSIWPDGYYMISQRGYDGTSSLDAWVFDRANMLNGNPATFQHPSFPVSEHDVIALPSDLAGPPPPPGSPAFYARPYDGNLYSDGSPRLEIFEFHTDWGVPANTTFKLVQTLTPATFRSDICDGGNLDQFCVPQPGAGTSTLDALSIWPMAPLQYRNFGDHETLVFSHAVNVDGAGLVGIRWYELRRTPPGSGNWVIQQQGTFSPADSTTTTTTSIDRWTSSVAMDQAGDMAMGYNVSNDGVAPHPTVYPGISVVGRLATDPPGEMTTPEVSLATGGASGTCLDSGNNVVGCRWGDYAAMRVDPTDGCTFWYTSEYFKGGGGTNQQTHVGAVRFPTCNPANLAVFKTDSPDPVTAGNPLTYTILVQNNGPSNATNVIVTDTLPAGVTFVSTSAVCISGTVTSGCNIGNLANGASASITVQVQVNSNISANTTTITNSVTVSADQLDPDTSDNTASASTTVLQSADLQVAKVCKPDVPAAAGTNGFCDVTVSNLGPSDAQSVVLNDAIVSNTPFTISSVTGASCSFGGGASTSNNVACNLGTLAAGGGVTVHVVFSTTGAGDVNDTATVSSTTPDPDTSNNTATGSVTFVSSADLSVTKVVVANSATCPFCAGTNVTYTISVSNAGPSTAAAVVVKDTIPAQESVLTVTPSAGSCTAGIPGNPLQPLTCTVGNLAPSGSAAVVVVAAIASNVPNGTVVNNNASVSSSSADPNNANNSATASVTVVAKADLAIVKTSDQSIYKPSSTIIYTINVTNYGPSDSLAVVVTDNLPNLKQANYLSDTGGCTKNASTPTVLICGLGDMPVGTSRSFSVYERVNGSKGAVSNTASVASTFTPPTTDPNAANNTSTRVVTVGH